MTTWDNLLLGNQTGGVKKRVKVKRKKTRRKIAKGSKNIKSKQSLRNKKRKTIRKRRKIKK